MKFVIAPDKFKESLTGFEFCKAVAEGISLIIPDAEVVHCPLADGGDGTMEVANYYLKGEKISLLVKDPLFRPVKATYLYAKKTKTAFIEMAKASGLHLLSEKERNCMHTTSYGTGELIKNALEQGTKKIILGIGGSATNDLGTGMATALGYRFTDQKGEEVKPTGENLIKIQKIETDSINPLLKNTEILIASDVNNPLYGPSGAAYIYAAQKGASEKEIELLDNGLKHLSGIIHKQLGIDLQNIPGSGAAGGLGGGAVAFLNGKIISGIEIIKDMADFDEKIRDADWIITGEGKIDSQTFSGKTIKGVIDSARQQQIPVAVFCGVNELSLAEQKELGIKYIKAVSANEKTQEKAYKNAYRNVVKAAAEFSKKFLS